MTETEKKNLVELLHQIVISTVPNVSTVEKYGGTLFTLRPNQKEGQFCGVFAYTSHVQLAFARGTELDDPDGVLEGGGKFRRHLNYKSLADVELKPPQRFLTQAAELDAG